MSYPLHVRTHKHFAGNAIGRSALFAGLLLACSFAEFIAEKSAYNKTGESGNIVVHYSPNTAD